MNRDYYAGMTQGRIQERERIIALIKQHRIDTNWTRTHFQYDRAISEITRLINGELSCLVHSEGKFDAGCTCEKGIAERVEKV